MASNVPGRGPRQKLEALFNEQFYLNPEQFAAYWAELESAYGPLLEEAKKEA